MTAGAEIRRSSYNIDDEEVYVKKDKKMVFMEEDLIQVMNAEMALRKKGWASKVVSEALRTIFEENGLFEKHGVENLKKKKK